MMIGACKGCGGMVRARTPQKRDEKGNLYHAHCYDREQKKEVKPVLTDGK